VEKGDELEELFMLFEIFEELRINKEIRNLAYEFVKEAFLASSSILNSKFKVLHIFLSISSSFSPKPCLALYLSRHFLMLGKTLSGLPTFNATSTGSSSIALSTALSVCDVFRTFSFLPSS